MPNGSDSRSRLGAEEFYNCVNWESVIISKILKIEKKDQITEENLEMLRRKYQELKKF